MELNNLLKNVLATLINGYELIALSNEFLMELVQAYGYIGFFIVSLLGTLTIVFPVPYLLIIYYGGASKLFNPLIIGVSAGLGATIGDLSLYFVGLGGRKVLPDKYVKRADSFAKLIDKYGPVVIFLFAATPLPDDVIYPALGVSKYSFIKIFTAAFLGKTVLSTFIAYAGFYSYEYIEKYLGDEGGIISSLIFIAFSLVVVYIVLKIDWEKYLKIGSED